MEGSKEYFFRIREEQINQENENNQYHSKDSTGKPE